MAIQQLNIQVETRAARLAISALEARLARLRTAFAALNSVGGITQLDRLNQAFNANVSATERATRATATYVRASTGLNRSLARMGARARASHAATERMREQMARTARGMDEATVSSTRLGAAMTLIGGRGLDTFTRIATNLRGYVAASRESGSATRRLAGAVLGLVGAFAGFALFRIVAAIKHFVQTSFEAITVTQGFKNALTAITGSTKEADKNLEFVRRTSERLGLGFKASVDGFRKFIASASLSGVATNKARSAYAKMSEVLTVLHANSSQTSRVFLALEQMFSKGKVATEELRRQLGDAIPGAFNIMAESIGVTSGQLDQMLRRGEVGVERIIPFIDLLNEKFKGGLAEALRSPIVAFTRLGNVLEQLQVTGGQKFFGSLATSIALFTAAIKGDGIQALIEFGATLAGLGIAAVVSAVTALTAALNILAQPLIIVNNGLAAIGSTISTALDWLNKLVFGTEDSASALENMDSKVTTLSRVFDAFIAGVQAFITLPLLGKLLRWTGALGALSSAVGMASKAVTALTLTTSFMQAQFFGGAMLSALSTSITKYGLMATAMTVLGGAVNALKNGFIALTAVMRANAIGLIISLAAGAAAAFVAYRKSADETKKSMAALYPEIAKLNIGLRAGAISSGQYAKRLLSLQNFRIPKLEIPIDGLSESTQKKFDALTNTIKNLASEFGANKTQAKSMGQEYAQLVIISEGLVTVNDKLLAEYEKQIKVNERIQRAIEARVFILAQEVAERKKNEQSVVAQTAELKKLVDFSNKLRGKTAILRVQADGLADGVNAITKAGEKLDELSARPALRLKIAEGDVDGVLRALKLIDDLSTSLNGTHEPAINAANAIDGLDKRLKTLNTTNPIQSFADSFVDAMNRVIDAIFRYNSTPVKAKNIPTNAGNDIPQARNGGVVPSFASGTPNTTSQLATLATGGDGGFPAILHQGEAVVPLPDGRNIPVKIDFPAGGEVLNQASSPNVNREAGNTNVNLTVNIQAQDAASFNRSQDQIYLDLQRSVTRAVRTIRN